MQPLTAGSCWAWYCQQQQSCCQRYQRRRRIPHLPVCSDSAPGTRSSRFQASLQFTRQSHTHRRIKLACCPGCRTKAYLANELRARMQPEPCEDVGKHFGQHSTASQRKSSGLINLARSGAGHPSPADLPKKTFPRKRTAQRTLRVQFARPATAAPWPKASPQDSCFNADTQGAASMRKKELSSSDRLDPGHKSCRPGTRQISGSITTTSKRPCHEVRQCRPGDYSAHIAT